MNKLNELTDDEVMREYVLSQIIRFNNRTRLHDESVAEHTCFVSAFCLKILAQLNLPHETEREVLILSAIHDMAESKISDIPHNVKANYPEMENILLELEKNYYKQYWGKYSELVNNPSDIAFCILKVADSYSVLQYCLQEKSLGNNSEDNSEIITEARKRIKKWVNKVNTLLEENNQDKE